MIIPNGSYVMIQDCARPDRSAFGHVRGAKMTGEGLEYAIVRTHTINGDKLPPQSGRRVYYFEKECEITVVCEDCHMPNCECEEYEQ